jgi:hypothetical protein
MSRDGVYTAIVTILGGSYFQKRITYHNLGGMLGWSTCFHILEISSKDYSMILLQIVEMYLNYNLRAHNSTLAWWTRKTIIIDRNQRLFVYGGKFPLQFLDCNRYDGFAAV